MDKIAIVKAAERLDKILLCYSQSDDNAKDLYDALAKMISDARTGYILGPIEWQDVPGAYFFNEKGLSKYGDLETAYAMFKIEVTGGESFLLKALRLNESKKHTDNY